MGENNQQRWRGIRPVNPPENIPVDVKAHTVNTPIIPASPEKVFTYYEPPEGATYVHAANSTAAATAEVYAVPADTIFYLTTVNFCVDAQVAGVGNIKILTDAPATYAFLNVVRVAVGESYGICHIFPIAMQLPASYSITIYSSIAGLGVYGQVIGYTKPV